MSDKEDLNIKFKQAVEDAEKLDSVPQDIMLEFYAYYKQATKGDHFTFNANIDNDVRSAFKFNAWQQLRGISPKKAKKEYIKLVDKYKNI
ncbi:acyl-CoA-binding protein [Flavobacteriaceae bacterium]|nr:acyl-CoA-binding protein [Flavobacteriaceae bacterium]